MAALAMAGLMGRPTFASSPMIVVLDGDEDDVARLKRLEAQRYERREVLVTDGELAEKLGRRQPLRNVAADTNRHTGEPHKHSREIARRLRQQARGQ
jgi:hypothetical protein